MAKLTFILQDGQEIEVQLREEITIGRSEDNEVVVDSPLISARHACVKRAGADRFAVQDLQSEGGTFVNDERVELHLLEDGDRLKFGMLDAVFAREFKNETVNHPGGKDLQEMSDWLKAGQSFAAEGDEAAGNLKRARRSGALDEELERSREQLIRTEAELQMQRQRLVEAKATMARAEAAGQDLADELQVLETRRDTMMGQLRDAHARLDSMQVAHYQAEQGRETNEKRAKELLEDIRVAEEQRVEALKRQEEAETLYLKAQGRLDELNAKVKETEESLAKVSTALEGVRAEEATWSAEVARLLGEEKRLNELCKQLANTEEMLGNKQQQLADLREQYELRNDEWRKMLGQTEVARWDWDDANKRRDDMATRLRLVTQEHEETTERLSQTLNEVKAQSARREQLTAEADAKLQEVRAYQGQLVHLQMTRDALQGRVDGLAGNEELLAAAKAALSGVLEQEESTQASLQKLLAERDEVERDLAQIALSLNKLEHESEQETVQLQTLEERNRVQREELQRVTEELAQKNEALKNVLQAREMTEQELEGKRSELSKELERLRGEVEVTTTQLQDVTNRRAIIAAQCEELADTEQKLGVAKADLENKRAQFNDLDEKVTHLTEEQKSLESSVASLTVQQTATEGRIDELTQKEEGLNRSIQSLSEMESVDRERFEAIQHLMKEAEKEKGQQAEQLDREILIKQRELTEIEDRLGQLMQWKDLMDQRYAQLEALPEEAQEAELLWNQLNQDKAQMAQLLTTPQQGGQTSYSHGPMLRGHARQLEAKIRRDEERHTNLRRKVEQMEAEEADKNDRLSRLERRLAQLRMDIASVEREHRVLGLEPQPDEDEAEGEGEAEGSRGILGSIVESARSKLKSM